MAEDKSNYTAQFVSNIKAKIAALQALLASVESAVAVGALGQPIEGMELSSVTSTANGDIGQPIDLPKDAFHGKSLPACVELYLSATPMKKRTNKEIAAALREGGVESNAKHFDTVVTGTLFGLKKAGKVLRFKDGWGLASWYPAHIRAATPAKPAKRAKKGSWKKKLRTRIDAKLKEMETSGAQSAPKKASERAVDFLSSKPGTDFSVAVVGTHIGTGTKGARLILGKLAKQGKVEKSGLDMYRIARPLLTTAV